MPVLAVSTLALQWLTAVVVAVVGMVITALFCGMETGIYVVNKIRLDLQAESNKPGARSLQRQLRRPQHVLVVLLVGTNLANYAVTYALKAMFTLGGAGDHRAELYTIAAATGLLFILGDSVPKNIFQRAAETLTYRLAWLVRGANVVLTVCGLVPLVRSVAWVLMRVVRPGGKDPEVLGHRGVAAIVAEGHASGALSASQSRMAERVMQLAQVHLSDAMVPMADVVCAPATVDRPALVELLREHEYRRLPLVHPRGEVCGILDIYDALSSPEAKPAMELAVEPLVLPADTTITDALYQMQQGHSPMAVVADEGGAHVGIVTMKDLVEEIVGELADW